MMQNINNGKCLYCNKEPGRIHEASCVYLATFVHDVNCLFLKNGWKTDSLLPCTCNKALTNNNTK